MIQQIWDQKNHLR